MIKINTIFGFILMFSGTTAQAESFSVETMANVEVSDGLTYSASTEFHYPNEAGFYREYADRTVRLKMTGDQYWRDEGDGLVPFEGDIVTREFILGHQVHAWLIDFDGLSGSGPSCEEISVDGEVVSARHVSHDRFPKSLVPCEGRPEMLIMGYDETQVTLRFMDWREQQGRELPFTVSFDDGSRIFTYRYSKVVVTDDF
jgi:hypothetical protein